MTGNPPFNPFEEKARLPLVRPKTRGECADVPRPCPFVSCRHHLYLDVDKNGSVIEHATDPTEMAVSCSLDVADDGEMLLEEIGSIFGIGRERVRQIEASAIATVAAHDGVRDHMDAPPPAPDVPRAARVGCYVAADTVLPALAQLGPSTAGRVAAHLGVPDGRAMTVLRELTRSGDVVRGNVMIHGRVFVGFAMPGVAFPEVVQPSAVQRATMEAYTAKRRATWLIRRGRDDASLLEAIGDTQVSALALSRKLGWSVSKVGKVLARLRHEGRVRLWRPARDVFWWSASAQEAAE